MIPRKLILSALAGTMLGSAAHAAPLQPRPVDRFIGGIMGNPTSVAQINARCAAYSREANRRIVAAEKAQGPATTARTLQAYDDLQNLLIAGSGEFGMYREVMADDARRGAGAACEVKLQQLANRISLSRPMYDRLKAIPTAGLDAPTALYLGRILASFERAGVALPAAQRKQAQALSDRISDLGTQFEKAIADSRTSIKADPAELDGLPADYIAAHKPGPDGKVEITTAYPDIIPAMTYARSEALRQRLYETYFQRGYPENDKLLREMLDKRDALAKLVGRKDAAALALEDKMIASPDKVEDLLGKLYAAALPAAKRDLARKLSFWQQEHPGAASYGVWNNSYITQQVQKRDFSYDRQEARQYFTYDRVRDGILGLTQDLFGVSIQRWNTPVWAKGVEAYQVFDHGKLIGRFYFDSHPRPGKYEHANQIPLRSGLAGRSLPEGALVMNLPGGDGGAALMEHNDVETFLHEFGHLIHHIFGGQSARWAGQSGVSTEWDFVEAPSQMLEEWVYDYDTIKTFAINGKGEVIPRDLVAKMNKARYFNIGMSDMTQLGYANVSLGLHRGPAPADLGARTRALYGAFTLQPLPETAQLQDSFGHLNGYSAIYYTYQWSKVIALDMFTRFDAAGLHDKATAAAYRAKVLSPGGTRPAADLVSDFLGRPINLDAYKADMDKDQ